MSEEHKPVIMILKPQASVVQTVKNLIYFAYISQGISGISYGNILWYCIIKSIKNWLPKETTNLFVDINVM